MHSLCVYVCMCVCICLGKREDSHGGSQASVYRILSSIILTAKCRLSVQRWGRGRKRESGNSLRPKGRREELPVGGGGEVGGIIHIDDVEYKRGREKWLEKQHGNTYTYIHTPTPPPPLYHTQYPPQGRGFVVSFYLHAKL